MKEEKQYKWVSCEDNSMKHINNYTKEGWRIFEIKFTDGGNLLSVVMERSIKT